MGSMKHILAKTYGIGESARGGKLRASVPPPAAPPPYAADPGVNRWTAVDWQIVAFMFGCIALIEAVCLVLTMRK